MIGNVVFYKDNTSFITKTIANITRSQYSHVALIIGFDEATNVATIIESNGFIRTRVSTIKINKDHVIYELADGMTEEVKGKVVDYATKQLGTEYDYLQILGLFLALVFKEPRYAFFNSKNKFICSELIDNSYYNAGIKRNNNLNIGNITPQELLEVYDLKKIM